MDVGCFFGGEILLFGGGVGTYPGCGLDGTASGTGDGGFVGTFAALGLQD